LRLRSQKALSFDIPDEYCDFLKITNGLDWNGLVVYASKRSLIAGYTDRFIEGFVEGNLLAYDCEPNRKWVVFAEDGTVLFAFHRERLRFEVVTAVGLSVLETFDTFEELLANAFQSHF
jgi:hypothetical protein